MEVLRMEAQWSRTPLGMWWRVGMWGLRMELTVGREERVQSWGVVVGEPEECDDTGAGWLSEGWGWGEDEGGGGNG